jgi:hypothetical protein
MWPKLTLLFKSGRFARHLKCFFASASWVSPRRPHLDARGSPSLFSSALAYQGVRPCGPSARAQLSSPCTARGNDYQRDQDDNTQVDVARVQAMVAGRAECRSARDFGGADNLRDELRSMGVTVFDEEKTWSASPDAGSYNL